MSIVYLLQNQDQLFFDKSGDWVVPNNTKSLYRTPFKDEVINQKVELSVKSPELRISVVNATINGNGQLVTEPDPDQQDSTDENLNPVEGADSANEDLFAPEPDEQPNQAENTADII